MSGLPVTPSSVRHKNLFPQPTIGPLGATAESCQGVPVVDLFFHRPSLAQADERSGHLLAWSSAGGEGQGRGQADQIIVVKAPLYKLASASWLHQYEHARFLHAGLPQSTITWPHYPCIIASGVELPALQEMHAYLSSLPGAPKVQEPDSSLWAELPLCEIKEEVQEAFKLGVIHFTGGLSIVKESKKAAGRLVFKLDPPSAGMGSALYRRFGNDRFFRINLDDVVVRRAAPSFDTGRSSPRDDALREQIQLFFRNPLMIFRRTFRPFCWKDGAAIYWCESGPGLEEIPLVDFAQRYLEVELNSSMSVAKYAARFELGLTTTIPTVAFRRDQVFRIPDLISDTLKLSVGMMKLVCEVFCERHAVFSAENLPPSYVPTCIRATVRHPSTSKSYDLVYQLDFSTSCSPSSAWIGVHSSCPSPQPIFTFFIESKDGETQQITLDDEVMAGVTAMKEVAQMYAAARGSPELGVSVPAVAQGRIGGGKGVWARAPISHGGNDHWIEIRDCQWKFKDRQTNLFTFDLHSLPSWGGGKSKLGKQLFEVLAHCGVPTDAFRTLLRSQITTGMEAFLRPDSLPALLFHIEKSSGVLEDRTMKARLASDPSSIKLAGAGGGSEEVEALSSASGFVHDRRLDPSSGAPSTVAEVVVEMLQSGFDPSTNAHLADKIKKTSLS
ncbi:hypothetical protein JCM8547_004752 [Rhodosporidiobolus lusitaniae]